MVMEDLEREEGLMSWCCLSSVCSGHVRHMLICEVLCWLHDISEFSCSPMDSGHWARYQLPLQFGWKKKWKS
jgi:hypothetical protein